MSQSLQMMERPLMTLGERREHQKMAGRNLLKKYHLHQEAPVTMTEERELPTLRVVTAEKNKVIYRIIVV